MIAKYASIDAIISGEPDRVPMSNVGLCFFGQHWQWDGVKFSILSPTKNASGNAASCVLRVGDWVLLPGDADAETLKQLAASMPVQAKVLVASHHGSDYNDGSLWRTKVSPVFYLVSVGAHNRYGHPSMRLLRIYRALGARAYRTSTDGTIRIDCQNGVGCYRA
jgi:competence protein ComEC